MDNHHLSKKYFSYALEGYIEYLVRGFVEDGILERLDQGDFKEAKFRLLSKGNYGIQDFKDEDAIVESFLRFRTIAQRVFYDLKYESQPLDQKTPFSQILKVLNDKKAFNLPEYEETKNLISVFDDGEEFLTDDEFKADIIEEIKTIGFNFNLYRNQLFEFYVLTKFKEKFSYVSFVDKPEHDGPPTFPDLIGKSSLIAGQYFAFEIKTRKKINDKTLRDSIYECKEYIELLERNYNSTDSKCFLILFVEEHPQTFKKQKYKFNKYLIELFPELTELIYFVPVFTESIHLLEYYLNEIKDAYFDGDRLRFSLSNKPALPGFLNIDDDYYPNVFDLTNNSFQISLELKLPIQYWRFGIKFSKSKMFPMVESRHVMDYPVFHLGKDENSDEVYLAFYDEKANVSESRQPIGVYMESTSVINFIIRRNNEEIRIELFDEKKSIGNFSYLSLKDYLYFKLFAWADGKNDFSFTGTINPIL